MPEYQCEACHYRFESSRRPYSCPYCGKVGSVKQEATASEILKEITEEKSG